jgi:hypothetical protein
MLFSVDSGTVDAPSYPAIAIWANPAMAVKTALSPPFFRWRLVWSVQQVLRRRFELSGEPPARIRGHGIARRNGGLNATALAAFEGRDAAAGPRRLMLRQQHSVVLAVRAAWALDGRNMRRRDRLMFRHDASWSALLNSPSLLPNGDDVLISSSHAVMKSICLEKP